MADKTPAPEPQKQKPAKKEKTIEDILNRDNRMMRSPILWFFLLGLPVVLCFYVAFAKEEVGPAREQPKAVEYTPEGEARLPPDNTPRRQMVACNFEEWVGKPADAELERAIKPLNRPYRILPSGARMTQDFSPSRINFDLNAEGKIVRVWCG